MEPIRSISQSIQSPYILQPATLQRIPTVEDGQVFSTESGQKSKTALAASNLLNQLPPEPTQNIANSFRSINILARQALELGLEDEDREVLQSGVREDLSQIQSLLDEFREEELTLFLAVVQNQIPGSFIETDSSNSDSLFDLSYSGIADNSLESLLNLSVLTESGTLNALNLTGSILSLFTGSDRPNILEILLEESSFSYTSSSILESILQSQGSEESSQSEDDDSQVSEAPLPTVFNYSNENPPTIIDFAG